MVVAGGGQRLHARPVPNATDLTAPVWPVRGWLTARSCQTAEDGLDRENDRGDMEGQP